MSFHEYTVTQFFTVFIAIIFDSQSMGQFFAHSSDISKGVLGANAILSMEQRVPKDESPKEAMPSIEDCSPDTPMIEFRDAFFAYPTRPDHKVLRGFNLKLYRGQFIALVGPSGCGKSTVIQLLERFYDLASGDILINGISVSHLSAVEVRDLFALVSQEPVLYQGKLPNPM